MSRSSVASGMTAVSIGDGRFSTSWKYTNHLSSCSFSVFSSVPCLSLIGPPVLYLYTHSFCDLVYSPLLSPYCRLLYLGRKLVHGFSLVSALANFDGLASFCCFQYDDFFLYVLYTGFFTFIWCVCFARFEIYFLTPWWRQPWWCCPSISIARYQMVITAYIFFPPESNV